VGGTRADLLAGKMADGHLAGRHTEMTRPQGS
jgi:hypothetical protein